MTTATSPERTTSPGGHVHPATLGKGLRHGVDRALDPQPLGKIHRPARLARDRGQKLAAFDDLEVVEAEAVAGRGNEPAIGAVLRAGDTPVSFEMPTRHGEHWRIGMSVCYDLRFGELYRMLAADLLLVPAAFTHTTGQAHWEVLLRARAIENQAYVIASAQGGVHENGRRTWGHSMVIDPWGQVMAMQAEGPGVVLADIDLERLRSVLSAQ